MSFENMLLNADPEDAAEAAKIIARAYVNDPSAARRCVLRGDDTRAFDGGADSEAATSEEAAASTNDDACAATLVEEGS